MTDITYTDEEVRIIKSAAAGVDDGTGSMTGKQLSVFAARVNEARESAKQVGGSTYTGTPPPTINKSDKAAKIQAHRDDLIRMARDPNSSPRLQKMCLRALKVGDRQAAQEVLDELVDADEQRKALVALRASASGADREITVKACNLALARMRDETLASIKRNQNPKYTRR